MPRISLRLAILIGSTAFLLGLLAGNAPSHDPGTGATDERAPALSAPPELPREWVWERETLTFEQMFRRKGERPRPVP